MTPKERLPILRSTLAILRDPDHWTKHFFCSKDGLYPCDIGEGDKYCILGATRAALVAHGRSFRTAADFLAFLNDSGLLPDPVSGGALFTHLTEFNDDPLTTHADILNYLTTAIAHLEATNA